MSILDTIANLTESAKKLRAIAEELKNVQLKSEIVDQIMQLQEAREQILAAGEENFKVNLGPQGSQSSSQLATIDARVARLEVAEDIETYSFHAVEEAPAEESPDKKQPAAGTTESRIEAFKVLEKIDLTDEQKAKLAELRIKEIEPKHQAAVQKLNDILTDEQNKAKIEVAKLAKKTGKKGKELQQAVQAAIKLTDEQKKQMAIARKELHELRLEIAQQIDAFLTDDQRASIRETAGKAKKAKQKQTVDS